MSRAPVTVADLKGRVDFAIITIKVEELRAVLGRFDPATQQVVTGARAYSVARVRRPDCSEVVIAITRCPAQGNGVAQDVARDVLDELDPSWLLVVGIACAVPSSEIGLGDVVLASHVLDFSVEAVIAGRPTEYAVANTAVDPRVENYVTMVEAHQCELGEWNELGLVRPRIEAGDDDLYGDAEWRRRTREALAVHHARQPAKPRVTAAALGSSDRLVKDDEVLSVWLRVARQVRAVEMESAGVHLAARGRPPQRKAYPTMSIRGISDIVGLRRDEAWTRYACESAAAFASAFVRSSYAPVRAHTDDKAIADAGEKRRFASSGIVLGWIGAALFAVILGAFALWHWGPSMSTKAAGVLDAGPTSDAAAVPVGVARPTIDAAAAPTVDAAMPAVDARVQRHREDARSNVNALIPDARPDLINTTEAVRAALGTPPGCGEVHVRHFVDGAVHRFAAYCTCLNSSRPPSSEVMAATYDASFEQNLADRSNEARATMSKQCAPAP